MREIVVFSMIPMDGVMQAPGGSKEDAAFRLGGRSMLHTDETVKDFS